MARGYSLCGSPGLQFVRQAVAINRAPTTGGALLNVATPKPSRHRTLRKTTTANAGRVMLIEQGRPWTGSS